MYTHSCTLPSSDAGHLGPVSLLIDSSSTPWVQAKGVRRQYCIKAAGMEIVFLAAPVSRGNIKDHSRVWYAKTHGGRPRAVRDSPARL
jgi:hypothetical protein